MSIRLSTGGARYAAAVALAGASLVAAAAVGSIFLSTAADAWAAIAAAGPAGPADGILLLVALAGALLSLWLGLGLALSALSTLPGALGRAFSLLAARLAPAAARKVVAFVLGTTLTAALVPATAVAGTGLESPPRGLVASAQQAVGSLADAAPDASFRWVSDAEPNVGEKEAAPTPSWAPERPAPPRAAPRKVVLPSVAPRERHAPRADAVVVQRGDTLWSIAARHLGPEATGADIDAEWHRWFAANRAVVGADADLIAPGQRLSPPAPSASTSSRKVGS
jgi:LysM repeat protein